jgi:hypothetical protein
MALPNLVLYPKFTNATYAPGENVKFDLWAENRGNTYLYVSEVVLDFDFGRYEFSEFFPKYIEPRQTLLLAKGRFVLSQYIVGNRKCTVSYVVHEYKYEKWQPYPLYYTTFIAIHPKRYYRLFLSRGLHPMDRRIGDPIAMFMNDWSFLTRTVGIEVRVPDTLVDLQVRREILAADAVILIATPRSYDIQSRTWMTLEWLHDEIGIAFGFQKPLLILKDKSVKLGGLPSYLTGKYPQLQIEFSPSTLEQLKLRLSQAMPSLRRSIEDNNTTQLRQSIGTSIIAGLAIVGGTVVLKNFLGTINKL